MPPIRVRRAKIAASAPLARMDTQTAHRLATAISEAWPELPTFEASTTPLLRMAIPTACAIAALAGGLWIGQSQVGRARASESGRKVTHAAVRRGWFPESPTSGGPSFGAGRTNDGCGDSVMNWTTRLGATAAAGMATIAAAGDTVQWRIADGGNDHWYRMLVTSAATTWSEAKALAESIGGHLATVRSAAENTVCLTVAADGPVVPGGSAWIGAWQPNGDASAYQWVTGEPFDWTPGCGFSNTQQSCGSEDFLTLTSPWTGCSWNDVAACWKMPAILVEFDADCNHDGIVDYGQALTGTLADFDGDNVPDCCERGEPCVSGNYPVQWRSRDGGNGHWYRFVETTSPRTWQAARDWATTIGAHLTTITDPAEQAFIISIAPAYQDESGGQAWLGGFQDLAAPDFQEPHGGWRWITGEPMTYQPWVNAGQTAPGSDFLAMGRDIQGRYGWNDLWTDYFGGRRFCFIEFDADCNSDGIVDYGQILSGQLSDINGNGVPDTCECATNPALPSCCPGDIYRNGRVDGADLGALLSEWGPVTPLTNSDLDGNGQVNGADLGILLAHWGPCGG